MTGLEAFKWTDEFSVGIEEIDNQHKVLFGLINRMFLAALKREDHKVSLEILDALVDYTKTHFALEERLLASAGYRNLVEHRAEHHVFVDKLTAMAQKFLADEKTITFELINFLKHWLKEHILETDMAYAEALAQSGFSTDAWTSQARASMASQNQEHVQKPWWRF